MSNTSSEDDNEADVPYQESDEDDDLFGMIDKDECSECLEEYGRTQDSCDWIKCVVCSRWLHESCSKFLNKCAVCGRAEILLKRKEEQMKKAHSKK